MISGIPWYYRQFGYDMALECQVGYSCPFSHGPGRHKADKEPYTVRPVTGSDLPFVARLYDEAMKRYLVSCVRDERLWRYELNGRSENTFGEREMCVVETDTGESMGLLVHVRGLWDGEPHALLYELKSGASWLEVTPSVLRYLQRMGETYATGEEEEYAY